MKVCILCEDANVAEARETAKSMGSVNALNIGVSKKGELPATHWFCFLEVDAKGYQKLLEANQSSKITIEETSPLSFLSSRNLKIIK